MSTTIARPAEPAARAAHRQGQGRRWRAPAGLGRGDAVALAVLVVLPVLAYGVPAALGHAVLAGDDASQNFPMRVLVGQQLAAGHLPLLDLRIWSGATELAGWNAGAAYPFTWLFAVLPATAAWAVNQMLVAWVAGMGLFAFLRANRLRAFPSALAALTFAYCGSMDAQMVHFGLVAGFSWVPVQLLGLLELSRAETTGARCRWAALTAVGGAMTVLAGEPRAIDVAAAVSVPYGLWRLWRARGRRLEVTGWVVGAAAVGAALGMVQVLPGLHAVESSQRAALTYSLFTSGSFPLRWLLLLLEPNLLGGSGSFGAPSFLANYNLTEVTAYVGILPWVAAFGLLGQLRRRRPLPDWLIWEVVAALGIVLALGGNTPAWHLLIHVPLYNGQRLQSRNIMVTDLAVAVLLGFWVDSWLARRPLVDGAQPLARRERLLAALPALGAAAVAIVSMTWGAGFLVWLGVTRAMANQAGGLRPWFVPTLVLGLGFAALLLFGGRQPAARRRRLLGGLVVADIVCFAATSLFLLWPSLGKHGPPAAVTGVSAAADPAPGPVVPVVDLHIPGRFGVYDPTLLDGPAVHAAGAPDENLLVGGWSFQGYSSIVNGTYAAVTGSHGAEGAGQDQLSVPALADGTFDQVDAGALLTLPQYLVVDADQAPTLLANGSPMQPVAANGRRTVRPGTTGRWTFGEPVSLTAVDVPVSAVSRSAVVSLDAVTASGSTVHLRTAVLPAAGGGRQPAPATMVTATVPRGVGAVGLVLTSTAAVSTGVPVVDTGAGVVLEIDGALQGALTTRWWRYVTQDGPIAVYAATHPTPPLTVRAVAGTGPLPAGTSVRRLAGPSMAPTRAAVDAPAGAVVVRGVADIPGWRAVYHPADGGPARTLAVRRSGLVQEVTVPPGDGVLDFAYRQPGLRDGALAAVAGLVAVVLLLALGWRRRQPLLSGRDGPGHGHG